MELDAGSALSVISHKDCKRLPKCETDTHLSDAENIHRGENISDG